MKADDKKKLISDGHVCEQKFASAKNEGIIPRKFHSSLITAVKNRLSSHWGNSRRTGLSTVLSCHLVLLLPFPLPFSAGATTVRFVYLPFRPSPAANSSLDKHSCPGRRLFWSPALYRYRALKAKGMYENVLGVWQHRIRCTSRRIIPTIWMRKQSIHLFFSLRSFKTR